MTTAREILGDLVKSIQGGDLTVYSKEMIDDALSSLRSLLIEGMPKKKFIIEQNKSPMSDIMNDCEVRREGYNRALPEITAKIDELLK
jgi:hypothetical protein